MHWKIWITSFIFIAVTVAKLVFPTHSQQLRDAAMALIDMDTDYDRLITAVGMRLTNEPVQEVLTIVEGYAIPNVITFQGTQEETDGEMQGKYDAFLEAQEAYSAYEIPANVSYDFNMPSFSYVSPVDGVTSSGFGYRIHPIEGQVLFHYGTDYDVEEGSAVTAFAEGIVTAVGTEDEGYGNYICISHADGWESLYAHCSEVLISSGQSVEKGQLVAKSGSTGRVTGPHLHFELTCHDVYTNPEFYLP